MNSQKFISWLTGILLLIIAGFGFASSYISLADLAEQHQFTLPAVFPLILEGGMIVFSLAALRASLHAERAAWPWVLVIGSSALATLFNVIHAAAYGTLAMVLAAMPSLFLLLSFETFMSQIKAGVKRRGLVLSIAALETRLVDLGQAETDRQADIIALETRLADLRAELVGLRKEKRVILQASDETKQRAIELLADNPEMTGAELGRVLGKSTSLGRKLKHEFSQNGRHA